MIKKFEIFESKKPYVFKYKVGDIVYYHPYSYALKSGYYRIIELGKTGHWYDLYSTERKKDPVMLFVDECDLYDTKEEYEEKEKNFWKTPRYDVMKHDKKKEINYTFQPGDTVMVNKNAAEVRTSQVDRNEYRNYDRRDFVGKVGVIISYWGAWEPQYLVHFDSKFSNQQYGGWGGSEDPTKQSIYLRDKDLDFYDPIKLEKINKEIEDKKIKMKEFDPWGEEDWEQ